MFAPRAGESNAAERDTHSLPLQGVQSVDTARLGGVVLGVAGGVKHPTLVVLVAVEVVGAVSAPPLVAPRHLKLGCRHTNAVIAGR